MRILLFNCTTLHDSYSLKSVTNRVFTVNVYSNDIFWVIYLCQLIYDIKHAFKISVISTHTCFVSCMPFCQRLRKWRTVAMLWQVCRHLVSMSGFVQTLESPEIKTLRFPVLESPGKGHRSWKTQEKSWNSKVVVLEIFTFWFKYRCLEKKFIVIHCVHFVTTVIAFGLVYCNAVTSKTDLVCALFDLMQPCLWTECILESP